jgi:hypothetical protein
MSEAGFGVGIARIMPPLACIGQIPYDQIGAAKLSEKGLYTNLRFRIEGVSGVSRGLVTNFLYLPEWFEPNFNAETIGGVEVKGKTGEELERTRRGMTMTHRRMFGTRSGIGQLQGMCGSPEGVEKMVAIRNKMWAANAGKSFSGEDIEIMLKEFIAAENPVVGYILTQEREATGMFDEAGKEIYEPVERYGVDRWFYPTDDECKRLVQSAEKRKHLPNAMRIAFEVS